MQKHIVRLNKIHKNHKVLIIIISKIRTYAKLKLCKLYLLLFCAVTKCRFFERPFYAPFNLKYTRIEFADTRNLSINKFLNEYLVLSMNNDKKIITTIDAS